MMTMMHMIMMMMTMTTVMMRTMMMMTIRHIITMMMIITLMTVFKMVFCSNMNDNCNTLFIRFQLRYGELPIRRAVPLALALISVSNPKLQILDTLSKFSHDSDPEVAHNAIMAMGIVGAGQ
jgi:hypothetical protein